MYSTARQPDNPSQCALTWVCHFIAAICERFSYSKCGCLPWAIQFREITLLHVLLLLTLFTTCKCSGTNAQSIWESFLKNDSQLIGHERWRRFQHTQQEAVKSKQIITTIVCGHRRVTMTSQRNPDRRARLGRQNNANNATFYTSEKGPCQVYEMREHMVPLPHTTGLVYSSCRLIGVFC